MTEQTDAEIFAAIQARLRAMEAKLIPGLDAVLACMAELSTELREANARSQERQLYLDEVKRFWLRRFNGDNSSGGEA